MVAQAGYGAGPNPAGHLLDRLAIAFVIASGIFVGARIAIRAKRQLLGFDDLWILIALISSIVLTVTVVISVGYGYGMHSNTLPHHQLTSALFWWYLAQAFYKAVTWPTKISILLMYKRVFGTSESRAYGVRFQILIWSTITLVAACFTALETAGIFACRPIQRSWDHSLPGTCLDTQARFYAYTGLNFFTDIIILALPLPLIKNLNIPNRQKWSLISVFLLGSFVCVTTLVRVGKLKIGADTTWSGTESVMWSCIEANTGIICACLPLLRPLLSFMVPWFSQRTRNKNTYDYGYQERTGPFASQQRRPSGHIELQGKGPSMYMSNITAKEQDSESRSSSQIGITQGIHKKVEVETYSEPAGLNIDRDWTRRSRSSLDRQVGVAA
ncbi:hypothetical protein LTR78_009489 [Recurvomyces mirabilis]|uniref:Rhodopsin domain-containing protein n=1 Tax=Recurvomyces mirabilis TaxID=574656 RepID=A0AAE0TPH7_9PEZI|nr:hypothetical protein LTR78_009489 [Recurvomyces mirabilis]KAK5152393.1 hypothetical protein LTS14_008340 [Recurvomyces mirabilis]